ncbi:amidohydrolase family protein [Amycolatopsis jejuensis]|uniref:amidohydrolase family protein n=1 Tax=Amycolatopsis jejuensis TaxID=330084 RepID=UPI00052461A1|nr:amidohydrolase family protein [Amycolatopsis jejuensis]
MPATTAFVHATVIDGLGGTPLRDGTILVEDGRFTAVGDVPVPPGAEVVDLRGRWVVPGFVNGNVHLLDGIMMMGIGGIEYLARHEGRLAEVIEESAQVALRSGVTTVFDTWNATAPVLAARDRIAAGTVPGARIFAAGNILGFGGPFGADFNLAASQVISPTFAARISALFEAGVGPHLSLLPAREVRPIVRDYLARGVDLVKVGITDHLTGIWGFERSYLMFSERVLRVIAEEAHEAGLPLLSHTMSVEGLESAIDLKTDVLIHASITSQRPIPHELVDAMAQSGSAAGLQTVTSAYQHRLESAGTIWAGYGGGVHTTNEKLILAAGVPVILGTDAGCTSHDVLADNGEVGDPERPWTLGTDHLAWGRGIVEKGMTPMQALVAATSAVARAYGKDADLGSITPGRRADLVVLREDPLVNVTAWGAVTDVYQDGTRVDRDRLPLEPLVTAAIPANA